MSAELLELNAKLDEVLRLMKERLHPTAEWEAIGVAKETRGVGRKKLLDAVRDGRVRSHRAPAPGGHLSWDLSVSDLDRHFPRRTTKQKANA